MTAGVVYCLEFVKVKSRNDINLVAALAREIWTEYYTPIIGGAQVEYMLENFQSEAAIAKNLGEGYHYRYYILRLDGADNELVFTYPAGGQMELLAVGFNVYEDCRGILKRNPGMAAAAAGFARVDAAFVERFFR